MKHMIAFNGCDNHWDNALPFGNGNFGCMLFYEDKKLHIPMNHYEIYYNTSNCVLPKDILDASLPYDELGKEHKECLKRANSNQPPKGEPFCHYRYTRERQYGNPSSYISRTHPSTGELIFSFSESFNIEKQKLSLFIEDAQGEIVLENNDEKVQIDTIVARKDYILNTVKQTATGIVSEIAVAFPEYRGEDAPSIVYQQQDDNTVSYTVTYMLSKEKSFRFSGVLRFVGAKVALKTIEGNSAVLFLSESETTFQVLTGIFTEWNYENLPENALLNIESVAKNIPALLKSHKDYWSAFFERSSIVLPDKFLEKVYVLNQYALDCCCGKGGVMKHHSCGLNGLWDIRRPTLWGSMWYWDVNIQAAFAGVFSSNRLELAKVFSDGLLSYVGLAEKFAKDVHGLSGVATDYPYAFYYSCWSWCAQYLWFLYEYSLDEEYLREEAYPLFLKLCEFTVGIFEYDANRQEYVVYPDISPEQGPLAHNTVITVACAKYLFNFTLKAARILGDNNSILESCKQILEKLPKYPISGPSKYGVHFLDSEDAPDNLWMRHPSILMPIFPIGEIDAVSDAETVKIANNTLDFLEENCEIGVFPGGWISAAAARMRRGQFAYRLLYERGIDHLLRSNGLAAEATNRYINFCLVSRQPLYYPCTTEFTGEVVAAVNEMLLQSHNGVICVFPALPDGDAEYGRLIRNGYSYSEYAERYRSYDAWKNVRFDSLLAKGAFEVSAELKDGKLSFIEIYSKKGGKVFVSSPYLQDSLKVYCKGVEMQVSLTDGIYTFDTVAGKKYILTSTFETDISRVIDDDYDTDVLTHTTYTRRKVYLGENVDTHYQKQIDAFLRDYYLGNNRQSNRTMLKFDFSEKQDKDYEDTIPLQVYPAESHIGRGLPINPVGAVEFTPKKGYGFSDTSSIKIVKRDSPDALRCDFLEGENTVEFIIDAPRGQYEFLVISGDAEEDSVTIAKTENSRVIGGKLVQKGTFQSEIIPFIQERDVPIRLQISTKKGYKWKLNALFLNEIRRC